MESAHLLCGGCSADGWFFGHLCPSQSDNESTASMRWLRSFLSGGYSRIVVRSDGEPSILTQHELRVQ